MRTVHLSRLRLRGAEIHELALLHAQWAVGDGDFAALRERRLAAGMPAEVTAAELAGHLMKLSLPEPGGTTITSVVRISSRSGVALVEHLAVRHGGAYRLTPSAEVPEVVTQLLTDARLVPGEIAGGSPERVAEDDIGRLVARLMSSERNLPMVLVSVENGSRQPIVDPTDLACRLAGMASVHFIDAVRSSHRLKEDLISAGFSEKFGCYNGGVRILWPGIVMGDDPYTHTLLLPMRLFAMPEQVRTQQVAGLFGEMIAEDEDPRAWLREVDPSAGAPSPKATQREVVSASVRELARRSSPPARHAAVPTQPDVGVDEARVAEAPVATASQTDSHPAALTEPEAPAEAPTEAPTEALPDAAPEPPATTLTPTRPAPTATPAVPPSTAPQPSSTWSGLAADVIAAFELAGELERDLDATRLELVAARQALRRAEQQRDELAEGATELADVADAVALAQARFPDRLLVLSSAQGSAVDSGYRNPELCFRVLALLALFGQQDGTFTDALVKALGNSAEWKPKDSPQTIARFGAQRTWAASDSRRKLFSRHVTLGGSVSAQRCLQIYYDVLPDGRIEVAWVGEHRPTVGKDT